MSVEYVTCLELIVLIKREQIKIMNDHPAEIGSNFTRQEFFIIYFVRRPRYNIL